MDMKNESRLAYALKHITNSSPDLPSKIIKYKLYSVIEKTRRTNVGKRWLSSLWPNPAEAKQTFTPTNAYLNYIGPGDIAGNHFHTKKREFFCPMGKFMLYLLDKKTKKISAIKLDAGTKEKYSMYYIPPFVPHAIKNIGNSFSALVVLTDKSDNYGNTIKLPFKIK